MLNSRIYANLAVRNGTAKGFTVDVFGFGKKIIKVVISRFPRRKENHLHFFNYVWLTTIHAVPVGSIFNF